MSAYIYIQYIYTHIVRSGVSMIKGIENTMAESIIIRTIGRQSSLKRTKTNATLIDALNVSPFSENKFFEVLVDLNFSNSITLQ